METRSRKQAEASSSAPSLSSSVGPTTRAAKRSRLSSSSVAPSASSATPSSSAPVTRSRIASKTQEQPPSVVMDESSSRPESDSSRRGRNQGSDRDNSDKGKEKEHEIRTRAIDRDAGRGILNIDGSSGNGDDDDNDSEGGFGILHQNLTSASSALQGLLRKLGAGLDDLLPSSAIASASSSHQSGRLKKILSGLRADGEDGKQVEALTQLCEMLSIGTEESLSTFSVDSFVPVLVGLLNHESNPDIMLLAARALTHLVDALPSSCAAVVHYGAVSCFCARLLSIEYMDLAEQSLQALKKISQEHPTACLRAGALMAVLSYLDFFSTGVQRVALATAANMCNKLPSDAADFVMEAVPHLTNLLQYHDSKVLEHASVCLTRIVEAFASSPEKLDELCNHGLVTQVASLISTSSVGGGQASLSSSTYTGLIRLLSTCASGSTVGAKTLLLLGASGILKDILAGSGQVGNLSVSAALSRPSKQLDTTVLQFQNQKLSQKLEVQKIEISALENKLSQKKAKQNLYDNKLSSVKKCWDRLGNALESASLKIRREGKSSDQNIQYSSNSQDGDLSSAEIAFHMRLAETGATESCSANGSLSQIVETDGRACEEYKSILRNLAVAVDDTWGMKDKLFSDVYLAIPSSDLCRQRTSNDLSSEVKKLRSNIGDLHLKHKSLTREMCYHQDNNLKIEAQLSCLRADLETTLSELEKSNHQLAVLKAEKDARMGLFYPVLSHANKHTAGDSSLDKQKELLETELDLKRVMDQSSSRLEELKCLYEERIEILKKLLQVQSTLKNLKCITSSNTFVLVSEELEKSKVELIQYHALYEKLQVERDNLGWHERGANIKDDLADVFRRSCAVADSRIHDLGVEIQHIHAERRQIEARLKDSSEDPGRKDVISNFKALISSFPGDMNVMQTQLSKYKEAADNVHSLRAHVQCDKIVLHRKAKELEALSAKSVSQGAEIQRLHSVVQDFKQTEMELNLYVEMYKRECTLSSDLLNARDSEFKAWAQVQSLELSLDERNLEFRVKEAIKAEAISQQRLAAAEAEYAELREKWDASKRELTELSDVLKSKSEENEAYLSEIETTGQAYDDMQNQNQHLLQQIIERDDYNIKLVLEGVKARQIYDALLMETLGMDKKIQQANLTAEFFAIKAARIEDQVKVCSDLLHRHKEGRCQNSATLDTTKRKLLDTKKMSLHGRESLEALQSKVNSARAHLADSQIEREKERFKKRRLQEDLEALKRKASHLAMQLEGGSSAVGKLRKEMQEYKEILKCGICHDRAKEVVITKCFHLFCNPCVQRVVETRHRKCPACATSFGVNDVKPVYI